MDWIRQQKWVVTLPIKPLETITYDLVASSDLPIPRDGASLILDAHWTSKPDHDDPLEKPVPVSLVTKMFTDIDSPRPMRRMKVAFFNSSRSRHATIDIYMIEEILRH